MLWGPRRGEATPPRDLLLLTVWGVLLALVAGLGGGLLLRSGFAVLRLWCHVLFCVGAPLLILRGLWWLGRSRRRRLGWALVALGLAMDGMYVYARRIEPFALEVNVHEIRSVRLAGLEARLRVVVLADLQSDDIGPYEERALREVDALKPDLLLLAGDYIQVRGEQRYDEEHRKLLRLVRGMRHIPKHGAYAVMGDTDPRADIFEGTRIRMLQREVVPLPGLPVQVLGLGYEDTFGPLQARHWKRISAFPGLTIVLGHRPDFMEEVIREGSRVPIIGIAGHTHGGQVVVPGFGPPLTLSVLPRKYASGVHQLGESWLCVSRGVGMERNAAPRIRFLCPPEIAVLDLLPN